MSDFENISLLVIKVDFSSLIIFGLFFAHVFRKLEIDRKMIQHQKCHLLLCRVVNVNHYLSNIIQLQNEISNKEKLENELNLLKQNHENVIKTKEHLNNILKMN